MRNNIEINLRLMYTSVIVAWSVCGVTKNYRIDRNEIMRKITCMI